MKKYEEPRLTKKEIEVVNGRLVQKSPINPVYQKANFAKAMQYSKESDRKLRGLPPQKRPQEGSDRRARKCFHAWQDRLPDTSPYKPKEKE